MPPPPSRGAYWGGVEVALIVIFDMWGYPHKHIASILARRADAIYGNSPPPCLRTVTAVANKLQDIRTRYPEMWSPKEKLYYSDLLTSATIFSIPNLDLQHVMSLVALTNEDIADIHSSYVGASSDIVEFTSLMQVHRIARTSDLSKDV